MVNKPALIGWTAGIKRLLKCIRCPVGDLQGKSAERGERSQFWQTVKPSSCYPEGICVQITQGDDAVGEGVDHRAIEGAIGSSPMARGDVNKSLPC